MLKVEKIKDNDQKRLERLERSRVFPQRIGSSVWHCSADDTMTQWVDGFYRVHPIIIERLTKDAEFMRRTEAQVEHGTQPFRHLGII